MEICQGRIFYVFIEKLMHLAFFGTILQIAKNFKYCKLDFFCIYQRIGTFGDVWSRFANFRNLQEFPSFFSEKFFYFDFDEICAKITVHVSSLVHISYFDNCWIDNYKTWKKSTRLKMLRTLILHNNNAEKLLTN